MKPSIKNGEHAYNKYWPNTWKHWTRAKSLIGKNT